ncbi:MAG TPA: pitrilysin family protein [Terriglobales bacterium]
MIAALLFIASGPAPRASERTFPPSVAPPEPVALPTPSVRTLPNGLRVLVVERHSLPVVTLRLVVEAGPETDPAGLPGTAQFAASMLNEGTKRRSPIDIAEAVDGAGGTFDSNADWDSTFAVLTVLADQTDLAFDLMADIALHPAFAPSEVERTRKQTISALDVLHNDPGYLADAIIDQTILAGTPYGHPADGTLESVKRLSPQDLAAFHARRYLPAKSVLAVVGDIAPETAFEQAGRYFGGWQAELSAAASGPSSPGCHESHDTSAERHSEEPKAAKNLLFLSKSGSFAGLRMTSLEASREPDAAPRVLIIDKADAVQTEIRVGDAGIPRSSPDYLALTVANQILGGPASNRLFSDLRGEHGLTYSASSDLGCYRTAGTWVAKTSTRTAETAKAVHRVLDQMKRMRDRPITKEELQQAVDYLIGHQALDFETSAGIADQFLDLMNYRLRLDTWNDLPTALRQLTVDDVWQATRRYLDPDQATIVLVGNASAFAKDMKKLGPERVIPIGALDLSAPGFEGRTGSGQGQVISGLQTKKALKPTANE